MEIHWMHFIHWNCGKLMLITHALAFLLMVPNLDISAISPIVGTITKYRYSVGPTSNWLWTHLVLLFCMRKVSLMEPLFWQRTFMWASSFSTFSLTTSHLPKQSLLQDLELFPLLALWHFACSNVPFPLKINLHIILNHRRNCQPFLLGMIKYLPLQALHWSSVTVQVLPLSVELFTDDYWFATLN